MSEPHASLTVDIVSDVVCPWCFIGKRHLETALAAMPAEKAVVVRWHPYELNPELPPEGIDRRRYVEAKFGGHERARQIYARVREAGERAGIAFDFDAIVRQPNTRETHRLIAWAQTKGNADRLVERLFRAYFVEGRELTDREMLIALAGESGIDPVAARSWLESGLGTQEIAQAETRVHELGITGVPFFIFNGRVGLSGAQPPEMLRDAIAQSREKV